MADLTFFRQQRVDGGIRMGLDVDGSDVAEWYVAEKNEDPALLWYIDVRCDGIKVKSEFESAKQWLRKHSLVVLKGLAAAAEDVAAGFDRNEKPYQRKVARIAGEGTISIACSAMRRIDALKMAHELRQFHDHWSQWIGRLEPVASFT